MIETPTIKTLSNGLTVCLLPFKGLQSATIHLKGRAGSNYEMKDELGIAHMLEHMVLQKTKSFRSQAHVMQYLTQVGGKFVAVTSRESVLFMTKVLSKDIFRGMSLLHEIFTNCQFDESTLEVQKRVITHEISRYKDIPEKMLGRVANRILYPAHRMATLNTGTEDDIKKISVDKLQCFYNRLYNANNFVLCICGDFDEHGIYKQIADLWEDVRVGKQAEYAPVVTTPGLRTQAFIDQNYARCHMEVDYYGFTIFDTQHFSLMCLAELFNSYANTRMRNELGLAYKVQCNSYSNGKYGTFSFKVSCKENELAAVVSEFKSMLESTDKIVRGSHLDAIKNKIKADIIFSFEKPSARAEYYSENLVLGNYKASHIAELEGTFNVEIEDVLNTAVYLSSQKPKVTVFSNTIGAQKIKELWQ